MSKNTITIIVLAILALGGGWYYFLSSPSEPPLAIVPSEEENFKLEQYRQLKHLEPDTSIVDDPLFRSLTRIRFGSQTPSKGRSNPFAPF